MSKGDALSSFEESWVAARKSKSAPGCEEGECADCDADTCDAVFCTDSCEISCEMSCEVLCEVTNEMGGIAAERITVVAENIVLDGLEGNVQLLEDTFDYSPPRWWFWFRVILAGIFCAGLLSIIIKLCS